MSVVSFPTRPPEPGRPLYEIIAAALTEDGSLPEDFSLPRPELDAAEQELRFQDGALDGIARYHVRPGPTDIHTLETCVVMLSDGDYEAADWTVQQFFSTNARYCSMLSMVNPLQRWVLDHTGELNAQKLYSGLVYLLRSSTHEGSVKLALSCLELFQTRADPAAQELIRTLGLSDEFTLYALFSMRFWSQGNEQIFSLAQRVHGWGRIHAVSLLQPNSDEIRFWLLTEGWKNNIMPEYSVRECVERSGLHRRLQQQDLTDPEWEAVCGLLPHLLLEGPVAGISGLENAEGFLDDLLALIEQRKGRETARFLLRYELSREMPRLDRIARCRSLLSHRAPSETD